MNYEEIIKALECCGVPYKICPECPMPNNIKDDCRCGEHLANYALDLINHQKTEIERLKKEIQITKDAYIMLQTKNEIIKSEVVKEFEDRLKNKIKIECNPYCKPTFGYDSGIAIMRYIDNLVKEKVNNEKGESEAMNKIFYLFIFADNSTYEMNCAVSFKDAVLEMAKNTGNSSDMFCKCLTAYKDDEIDEIIELFNHFCSYDYDEISKVYVIDRKIFDDKE